MVPLVLGWVTVPTGMSLAGIGSPRADRPVREPVPGLLAELDGGWLLIDSGLNAPLLRDAAFRRRFFSDPDVQCETAGPADRDPLEWACGTVGVDLRDIVAVAVSHFHFDHVGGLRHFAGRVPVYAQRREFEAATRDPLRSERSAGMFRIDWDDPSIDWRLLDGDAEIAPGVDAVLTAGHTAGHQSFVVRLDERGRAAAPPGSGEFGGYVFACDAADLQENLDREWPVSADDGDHASTVDAIRRLKALARRHRLRVIPGHDPVVWPAFAAELGVPVPS